MKGLKVKKDIISIKLIAIFAIFAFFIIASFAGKYKEIYFSEPKYLKRSSEPWLKHSRVVGELKNPPPSFTIEIYSHSQGKVIKTETFSDKITVYETGWIPVGTYTLEFKAKGFEKSFVKSLKLESGSDCLINVEFGKIEYHRNY